MAASSSEAWSALTRYRPFIVAVVAVLLVVLVPAVGDDDDENTALDTTGPAAVAGSEQPGAGDVGLGVDGSTAVAGESGAPAAGGGGVAAGTVPGASGDVVASSGGYPGVGTPEALQHPNCDPETGKIKFPSKWAPVCVKPWPGGDNGGATAPGISKDKIRIVVRLGTGQSRDNDAAAKAQMLKTFDIYNKHFELWGRQMEVVFFKPTGADEVAQRADAIKVATDLKPFIVLTLINATGGPPRVFGQELAARGIMSYDPDVNFKDAQAQPGFRWGFNIDDRLLSLQVAEYVGKRVQGQPARWAGDTAMRVKPRVIGLVFPEQWEMSGFDAEAAKYNLKLADRIAYPQGDSPNVLAERARTVAARLKDKGVTTAVLATDAVFTVVLTKELTAQQYFPELVSTGWALQDVTLLTRLYDPAQSRNMFGLGTIPPLPDLAKEERTVMHQWHYGAPPDEDATHGNMYLYLRDMAAAYQLAGPNLNRETYRQAMFGKAPAGGAHCGCFISTGTSYGRRHQGLTWDDYSGFDDTSEGWWDPQATAADEVGVTAPGIWRRVSGGKRYTFGKHITGPPDVFNPATAVYTYAEVPPPDRWKDYPHQPH